MNPEKIVGLTAGAGFQIGVRRTIALSQEKTWELLISPQGRKLWLGETPTIMFEKGQAFCSKEGVNGVFASLNLVSSFVYLGSLLAGRKLQLCKFGCCPPLLPAEQRLVFTKSISTVCSAEKR